jgi:ribosomal protein L11 methyltransferase
MRYPALDVRDVDADIVLATVDDFSPTAVEETADGVSIFFSTTAARDEALAAVSAAFPAATTAAREVDDEDWARRSQRSLMPVSVGRITVTPPWAVAPAPRPPTSPLSSPAGLRPPTSPLSSPADLRPPTSDLITITIAPSMGFGTGHHATTRLCLAALQALDVTGKRVLDVGTGSGILALAAARLGAQEVLGIDVDRDAVAAARENLEANPEARGVRVEVADLRGAPLPRAHVVIANLTGAVLVQNAELLQAAVTPDGSLVLSGIQAHERDDGVAAVGVKKLRWSAEEDGWVALTFNFPAALAV